MHDRLDWCKSTQAQVSNMLVHQQICVVQHGMMGFGLQPSSIPAEQFVYMWCCMFSVLEFAYRWCIACTYPLGLGLQPDFCPVSLWDCSCPRGCYYSQQQKPHGAGCLVLIL